MASSSAGLNLLNRWLEKIDLFSDGYDQVLFTGGSDDTAVRAAFEAAFRDDPITLHWAQYYDFMGVSPDPATRIRVKYWSTFKDSAFLDQAITSLEDEVRTAERESEHHAKALATLVYARTEQLLSRTWRAHALGSQEGVQISPADLVAEADYCRQRLNDISGAQFPQEAGLVAYNFARVMELRGESGYEEALEGFLLATHLFHATVEQGRRIFNAPRFVPHQREFWSCLSAAIRLSVALGRKDLAVCLSQLIKFGRSPISVFPPKIVHMEYLPDPSLFARIDTEHLFSKGTLVREATGPHLPPTVWELGKYLSAQSAILDIYRHDDALLLTLLDKDGIQCVGIPMVKLYQECPSFHRLVRLVETDFSLDEERAAWVLDYPQVRITPKPDSQWAIDTTTSTLLTPFTPGLDAMNELYGVLFRELDKYLVSKGITKLAISPDGTLSLVPFAVLIDDAGKFLADRYCFSYTPNLSTLLSCLSRGPMAVQSATLLRDLSGTLALAGDEIRAVAGHLGRTDVREANTFASAGGLLGQLATSDLIHFACHGLYDSRQPDSSGIVLTPNYCLPADAISEHGLKSGSLAVLSACETAHSNVSQKHGIPGLSHAFLRAGVTTVIASLWKVPDVPAYLLMSRFYELLFQNRGSLDVVEALTAAQRWLRDLDEAAIRSYGPQAHNAGWGQLIDQEIAAGKRFSYLHGDGASWSFRHAKPHPDLSRPFSNPYNWSGFVVIGDWRQRRKRVDEKDLAKTAHPRTVR